ncbi:hypothetical protein BDN72DRAFT_485795 [Pluteus cervinus]|uniref:Uncharacterized protein n=1 Tax=Pluteus cervinus TaxID=181527 RepID=A0ACD3A5X7_9AGAR|nr:hypothetical protein BDN72DRAFT_485795 [Pluteus cervinus]
MTLPEPSWRVKTRPCPFYQQGRCLFADSCNFLHNVSIKATPTVTLSQQEDSPAEVEAKPRTPLRPPVVMIQSPQSMRSPPRSPRMNDLLSALRGVIAEEPEEPEEENGMVEEVYNGVEPSLDENATITQMRSVSRSSEDGWTMVDDAGSLPPPFDPPDGPISAQPSEPHPSPGEPIRTPSRPPSQIIAPGPRIPPARSSCDLLSPVNMSVDLTHFSPFSFRPPDDDEEPIDSGYADTWKSPRPLVRTPPRSPAMSSTFDLLSSPFGSFSNRVLSPRLSAFINSRPSSPAAITGDVFPTHEEPDAFDLDSPSVMAAQIEAQVQGDTIDTPAHHTPRSSTPSMDVISLIQRTPIQVATQSPAEPGPVVVDEGVLENDAYGEVSHWSSDGQPTAVYAGTTSTPASKPAPLLLAHTEDTSLTLDAVSNREKAEEIDEEDDTEDTGVVQESPFDDDEVADGEDECLVFSSTPQKSSSYTDAFAPSHVTPKNVIEKPRPAPLQTFRSPLVSTVSSSLQVQKVEGNDIVISGSPTARLAYLMSPNPDLNENDTIDSFYDAYGLDEKEPEGTEMAEPVSLPPPGQQEAKETPTPPRPFPTPKRSNSDTSSLLRERVFTPPLADKRRSSIRSARMIDSPSSLPSPSSSAGSISRGRNSPFSPVSERDQPTSSTRSQSPDVQEIQRTSKVPFGFRQSFALGGVRNSSLISNRLSKGGLPSAPLPDSSSTQTSLHSPFVCLLSLLPIRFHRNHPLVLRLASRNSIYLGNGYLRLRLFQVYHQGTLYRTILRFRLHVYH